METAIYGTDLFGNPVRPDHEQGRGALAEAFGYPPFSVLNAREGWWQARKQAWISLGIQSELGRGGDIVPNGSRDAASQDGVYERGYGKSNGLLGFSQQARSHYNNGKPLGTCFGTEGNASEQSGTSIFDPVLCELAYRWFCPPAAAILDPFAGGSVRGIVASLLGHTYYGIDLSAAQIEANREQAGRICEGYTPPVWFVGDSAQLLGRPAKETIDFVFSCPPYFDLEQYSDHPADLSTMEWETFLDAYRFIIQAAALRLKPDRFAAFVVGEIRDKNGMYRNFVGETVRAFGEAGLRYYNEIILVTAVGSLPVRVNRQFRAGRKVGKTHQQMLVFVKGDPFAAREWNSEDEQN